MTTPQAASTLEDAALVGRCREGDGDAWRELVERYSRYVFAICTQAFRLPQEQAEDVFQDVFAKAYERLESLRDGSALRPWLAQLTRRACIDHLRASARAGAPVEELDTAQTDRDLARIDEAVAVHQAMDTLGEDCRDILDRFFCRDESYRDISDELGIPSGTIASRISRCLAKLRDAYTGRSAAPDPS
jgi:RNA polymerase sigma-70 factor (ECF subfamily)